MNYGSTCELPRCASARQANDCFQLQLLQQQFHTTWYSAAELGAAQARRRPADAKGGGGVSIGRDASVAAAQYGAFVGERTLFA